jgi:hypothetical protein
MDTRPIDRVVSANDSFEHVFENTPPTASVETDRYCDGCGYNLRLQPVRRDPRTKIPMARCPECGMFHAAGEGTTAGKLWLYRASRILLLLWVVVGWSSAGLIVMIQAGISYSAAEMIGLTFHERNVRMIILAATASLLLGLVAAMICRVAFVHWKWWSFVLASLLWPTLAAFSVWFYMGLDTSPRHVNALICVIGLAGVQTVGGLLGVVVGRPLARAMIVALVPPSARPVLDYLWKIDGRDMPTTH